MGARFKAFLKLLSRPSEQVSRPEGWCEVAVVQDSLAAGMLESTLRAEGIPVLVQKPGSFSYTGSVGFHGILVPPGMEERARELLDEMEEAGRSAEAAGPEESHDTGGEPGGADPGGPAETG